MQRVVGGAPCPTSLENSKKTHGNTSAARTKHKARIRRFLIETEKGTLAERNKEAVLIRRDGSFVHQDHMHKVHNRVTRPTPPRAHNLEGEREANSGRFRTASVGPQERGRARPWFTQYRSTRPSPRVTSRGVPIKEAWFGAKRGQERPRACPRTTSDEP